MAWDIKIRQLNDVLSDLVPIKDSIPKYVQASGLKLQHIDTSGSAMDVWSNVIAEANKQNKLNELVQSVLKMYPDNPFLKSALSEKEIRYSLGPDIKISEWGDVGEDTLELLTMGQSTLLPVNFLAKGVIKSKSVGKVEIKVSGNRYNVGTGFLCKVKDINDLFFITNYHVINHKDDISRTRIIFDYELDIYGNTIQSKSFEIDVNGPWYCSEIREFDTTVFKLKDEDNQLESYGYIELNEVTILKNDFVNIIQHPGGELKQISLYHNIVTNTTDRVVQYLTDTLKGSSGSPVFNSDWQVIALHHSGGGIKEGEPDLPFGIKSRNEGIYINRIIEFIRENHKK
ncbi:V8-like Glu-specific endopeptidase [Flavobacterium nitrogenifigens]|uniref:Serine protease n=2 Tax=Flavobacterium TaxID=237 RepID=A0A7W7IXV3_9FLAO|nr:MULTISPECIES: trypsin-like peptidase domain-containing protein [Flavobacterium]MBB4802107.1 V8-like Glu-specific endopeptidase [Flavobacterium nitrogenifigens]MBB6387065.1 V8-like Glu-specific endopeptidase [Flavobacterium notoginsengisoli]